MGLTGSGLNRFRGQVDSVLADAFPAEITWKGTPIIGASCPGGRVSSEYVDSGEATNYRFPFRFPVTSISAAPTVGDEVVWIVDPTTTLLLEVIECSRRPHEDRYSMICRKRRV